ncbi:hypothetical protein QUF80_20025 [Desulfococcaceae bacterium HSG8]|nr:hypothetical protein [Desulfococcaceae bacterium HSG8]
MVNIARDFNPGVRNRCGSAPKGRCNLRAKQEPARAKQERLRAERLAEKLREMGIDPNGIEIWNFDLN